MTEDEITFPLSDNFPEEIEEIVWMRDCSTMDAVLSWAEQKGIEPEVAGELILKYPSIHSQIQLEAENLNMLKEKSPRIM